MRSIIRSQTWPEQDSRYYLGHSIARDNVIVGFRRVPADIAAVDAPLKATLVIRDTA
jgi:hypothetical protein